MITLRPHNLDAKPRSMRQTLLDLSAKLGGLPANHPDRAELMRMIMDLHAFQR